MKGSDFLANIGKTVKTATLSGWSKFWHRMAVLIDVKSIVTLALVFVLCFVTLRQMPTPELFSSAVMLVLGFFFGKNTTSKTAEDSTNNNINTEVKS